MRTLLVDNHDSYTYNVFHLLAAASGEEPVVVNNDAVSWRVLSRSDFDAIVLSPGPGRPERWHDFGVCRDILRYSEIPVLGICLGHQGIGNLLEGDVSSAPMAMHGRLSHVRHSDTGIFEGIPQDFSVVRYHSLAITGPPGPEGHVTAWADDGVVMGIEHTSRPIWGVQFHPESIATEHGRAIAENFYALASRLRGHRPTEPPPGGPTGRNATDGPISRPSRRRPIGGGDGRRCGCGCGSSRGRRRPSTLFERLFARRRERLLARQRRRADLARPVLLPGHQRRPRALPARIRRRRRRGRGQARAPRHRRAQVDLRPARPRARQARGRAAAGAGAGADRRLRRLPRLRAARPTAARPTCTAPTCRTRLMMLANRVVAVDHVRRRTYVCAVGREDDRRGRRVAGGRRGARRRGDRRPAARRPPTPAPEDPRRPRHLPLRPRPRALPRRHRRQPGRTGGGRVLRGLPHRPVLDRRQPRPVRPLPPPAAQQPGAVRRLPQVRRARDRQLLAGALPLGRPRPPGRGAPDQGDDLPQRGPGRRRRPPRRARRRRKDHGRAPDDRRPAAQRRRPGLRRRQRQRPGADGDRALRDRAPDRLDDPGLRWNRGARRSSACTPASPAAR